MGVTGTFYMNLGLFIPLPGSCKGERLRSACNGRALRVMPKLILEMSTSLYFYGAILVFPAILIGHFNFVVFDPDVYYMDSAWLIGKSPRPEHRPSPTEKDAER